MTAAGILCPICNDGRVGVLESRPLEKVRRRRYQCDAGHRFSTLEVVVEDGKPVVVELNHRSVNRMSLEAWLSRRVERATTAVRESFQ